MYQVHNYVQNLLAPNQLCEPISKQTTSYGSNVMVAAHQLGFIFGYHVCYTHVSLKDLGHHLKKVMDNDNWYILKLKLLKHQNQPVQGIWHTQTIFITSKVGYVDN